MSHFMSHRSRLIVSVLLALLIAACGGQAAGTGGAEADDSLTLSFSSPAGGSEVPDAFTVGFDSNVLLGEPGTGNHHVHLCVDSEDCSTESEYTLVYGNTFEVTGLTPGKHTLGASLRNADHSDAGPGDEIEVTVAEAGTTTDQGADPDDVTDTTTGSDFDY